MTPERFVDVVARGVRSLSISLDGMRATTNDVLRIGTKVGTLIERLRAFTTLRRERALDVRLGVSWVCTRANLGEIDELVSLAAEIGLDYVKLEEIFGHEQLAIESRVELDRVVARAKQSSTTIVDHTRPMSVWRCQLDTDARMKRFALADDTANRTEINPCRHPWEQACIEPNGDVRPVTFHHPIAGNVLRDELATIWNSPACVDVRRQMRALRPCGAGPTTCAPDVGPGRW